MIINKLSDMIKSKSLIKTQIIFVSFLILFGAVLFAQQTDERMQSVFLYNFTRLVSWPAQYQSGDFVIGVYGSSPMLQEVEDMASTRKVGNQDIIARRFNSPEDITRCHILYVPNNQARSIDAIVSSLKARNIPTLVVSDTRNGTRRGAVVNFTIDGGRQRFELSQSNARDMGLTLGGEILRLAIVLD